MKKQNALTIAGFDPSGGAGVWADARTFDVFGYRTSAVITSITFQNDRQAHGRADQTAETVSAQIKSLVEEFEFACVKLGMLPNREVIKAVARSFADYNLAAPIVDPVMCSSSGMRLMDNNALEDLVSEILPLARLVTPNIPEAEVLSGMQISSEADMRQAASLIRNRGARAVLIKGGHLNETNAVGNQKSADLLEAIDLLDEDSRVTTFRAPFIPGAKLRGSGCILSSAIAAGLGNAMSLEEAVRQAKQFVLKRLHA
ncbi:MAG TPA: bifunctional hydroxymethylpyrimidine kinase/phosphomethylpyrimidine kinase [Pyrinomonadaceae bacterium]|nr:bifunctional hydroxymethylpyrimidine kinase/phosphomethylpyrimidine kinase [Pyrinomonadaceae bacterium]